MMTVSKLSAIVLACVFSHSLWAATGEPIRHVKTTEKVVALTYDDGPDQPYTQQILDVLNKNHVKATFFVLGGNAKAYPNLIKEIMSQGHELGNHTMSHSKMKGRSVEAMMQDIQGVDTILRNQGYTKPIPFRAPFGITSDNLKTALQKLNKEHVLFNFLPQDWTKISADQIYNNVMKEMKPGLIITLHDGGNRRENTVKATQMLITTLQQQGYRFVTVSELLELRKQ